MWKKFRWNIFFEINKGKRELGDRDYESGRRKVIVTTERNQRIQVIFFECHFRKGYHLFKKYIL